MRTLKYLILAIIGLCLIIIGFANRGPVTLTLLPDELVPFAGVSLSVTLPIYMVVFGGIAIGLLIGFILEWIREHKHRAEATSQRREKAVLAKEVQKLKKTSGEDKDEVVALLEGGGAAS